MNKLKYILVFLCLFITTGYVKAETTIDSGDSTPTTSTGQAVGTTTSTTRNTSTSTRTTNTSRSTRTTNNIYDKEYESTTNSTIIVKSVEGTSYKIFIDDKVDLLTSSEEEALFHDMEKLASFGNIGFLSIRQNTSSEAQLAENYYVSNFGKTYGMLFMINMGTRQLTLRGFSEVAERDFIDSNKVDSILSNVYRYAHNGNYYKTAKSVFEQSYTVIGGKAIFEPMKIASNIILSFAISSFILYMYVLGVSSVKKASNKEIIDCIKNTVNINNVSIQKTGTRSVYSPQSSSSSGGGGGGGFSGGGGGGGFHSSGGSHGF